MKTCSEYLQLQVCLSLHVHGMTEGAVFPPPIAEEGIRPNLEATGRPSKEYRLIRKKYVGTSLLLSADICCQVHIASIDDRLRDGSYYTDAMKGYLFLHRWKSKLSVQFVFPEDSEPLSQLPVNCRCPRIRSSKIPGSSSFTLLSFNATRVPASAGEASALAKDQSVTHKRHHAFLRGEGRILDIIVLTLPK